MGTRVVTLLLMSLGAACLGDAAAEPREPSRPDAGVADAAVPAPAPALAPAPATSAPLIASVDLSVSRDADPRALAELVTLKPGMPLSRVAARRTVERLWATGLFSEVEVVTRPAPDGRVAVVIEAETRTFVDRVEFEGNRVLGEDALRKSLALTERRPEYYPEFVERLAGRLRAAYRRIGHTRVQLEHALLQGDQGQTVLSFQVREGEPTRISAVHVAGDPQLPIAEVLQTFGLCAGDVLDEDRMERGLAALKARYRAEAYYRARFGEPRVTDGPEGAAVSLPITAGPRVEFRFRGNRAFDDEELRLRLAYDPEEPLDEGVEERLVQRLVAFYRAAGLPDAKVRVENVRSTDRRVRYLVFNVVEGAPLRVTEVRFEGNQHFTTDFLKARVVESLEEAAGMPVQGAQSADEVLLGGPARKDARFVSEPTTVWFEPAYAQALKRIVQLYVADGYLSAAAAPPMLDRDESRREGRVRLRIVEGPQTRVREVTFPGAPDPVRARAVTVVAVGKPYNSLDVETSRQAIKQALGQEGRAFAKVEDETVLSADRTEAFVAFRVVPGPTVRVGRVVVQGSGRTAESVVRGALALQEGGLLDPERLALSQRNLVRLGIFRTVALRMNAPDLPEEVKDVYVAVDERPSQAVSLGVGYSFMDGPRMLVEYTRLNLFGRALQFQGRAKFNYFNLSYPVLADPQTERDGMKALGRRINLSLAYPRLLALLPVEVGVRLDLVHEFVNRPAYDFQRTAALLGADVAGRGGVSASLSYEVESDEPTRTPGAETAGLTRTDYQRLQFPEGVIYLHSLRPTINLDWRDDPANPQKGLLASLTTEFVQSLGGELKVRLGDGTSTTRAPNSLFVKASANVAGYVPLWRGTVLALSLKGGKIFHLTPDSETIQPKRFFLGGAGSMRGFSDDGMIAEDQRLLLREQVRQCNALLSKTGCSEKAVLIAGNKELLSEGGELFVLGRAELRIPLSGSFDGALFFDTGNLWLDQDQFDVRRLRYAAGVGLRLVTPIGPAALDVGFNLDPDLSLNEAVITPHFSIGVF